jgi:hypothetical protein
LIVFHAPKRWERGHFGKKLAVRALGAYPFRMMKLEEIAKEAAMLPEEERASLASRLLHGLETPVYDVSDEEVFRRIREADEDPTVLITFEELVSGLHLRGR